MALLIRALSLNGEPLSQSIQGIFDESGGTIGRADSNTMALPDPQRLISRVHARVWFDQGSYFIEDVGAGVPSLLNGKPVGSGTRTPLRVQDELRISAYRLVVDNADDGAYSVLRQRTGPLTRPVPVAAPLSPERRAPALGPSAANPFADLFSAEADRGAKSVGAFDDLLVPEPAAPAAARGAARPSVGPGAASADPAARLPDDFDPFSDSFAPPPAKPLIPTDPLAMLGDTGRAGSLDEAFGLGPDDGKDPLANFLAPVAPAPPAPGGANDPMRLLEPQQPARGAPGAPVYSAPNHTPDLRAGYAPPRIIEPGGRARPPVRPLATPKAPAPPREVPPRPAAAPPAAAGAAAGDLQAGSEELWQSFLDGAGLPPSFPQRATPFVMRVLGILVHDMVDGLLQMIRARALTKNELRAEATLIQARNNNPLKFSPNVQVAMSQLLQPPAKGFMPAPEAVRDALNDLTSHQIGTMAGMRAALEGLLKQFEPARLEGQLVKRSALDALLPASRKAKLWDMYTQHYQAIRDDAEEGFHDLYGKAFVAAYEEQVERLRRAQANAKR
jgi:FHA domain-containing protein